MEDRTKALICFGLGTLLYIPLHEITHLIVANLLGLPMNSITMHSAPSDLTNVNSVWFTADFVTPISVGPSTIYPLAAIMLAPYLVFLLLPLLAILTNKLVYASFSMVGLIANVMPANLVSDLSRTIQFIPEGAVIVFTIQLISGILLVSLVTVGIVKLARSGIPFV